MPKAANALLVALAGLAACAAPGGRQREVAVLPSGDGSVLRFDANEVAALDAEGRAGRTFANRGGGAPSAAALELAQRLAVVACPQALAVTDLGGVAEPTWVALPERFAARTAALRQDRCALVGRGRDTLVVQLPAGNVLWRGAAGVRLDEVALVVPTGPAEQVVLGRRGEQVFVQRLDLSRGDGELTGETLVPRLTMVGAAATAGGAIFAAGLREESTASTRGALKQYLVIVRIDPATFRVEELVYERTDALEARVTDVAVGQEMLAVTVWLYGRGTRLRVYDQVKDRHPANWSFDKGIADGSAVAWLSPDYVAVVGANAPPQILQVVGEP